MGRAAIIEVLRHYFGTQPVLKASLFGSFLRGEETPSSDVGIIVSLDITSQLSTTFTNKW